MFQADIINPKFAVDWMHDFEDFQKSLEGDSSYVNDLVRSLSLVLDEFYCNIKVHSTFVVCWPSVNLFLICFKTVPFSSITGEGLEKFFKSLDECAEEYTKWVFSPTIIYESWKWNFQGISARIRAIESSKGTRDFSAWKLKIEKHFLQEAAMIEEQAKQLEQVKLDLASDQRTKKGMLGIQHVLINMSDIDVLLVDTAYDQRSSQVSARNLHLGGNEMEDGEDERDFVKEESGSHQMFLVCNPSVGWVWFSDDYDQEEKAFEAYISKMTKK